MTIKKLLIANRGEIAIRISTAAAELDIETLAVYAEDDADSLHCFKADDKAPLAGFGAAAYLDIPQIIDVARHHECDAVHPGYGFLSENADFARQCEAVGLTFVGPTGEVLDLFANKAKARALAENCDVSVIPGSKGEVSLKEAEAFFAEMGENATMMVKAVAGGGGRGMRIVSDAKDIEAAFNDCQSEAMQAFGDGGILVEKLLSQARHIEIQLMADHHGAMIHLGERECSIQRRNQKIIEIAPCPDLSPRLRDQITAAALKLAKSANYQNIGTFEFLVDGEKMLSAPDEAEFFFLEANPRVQVEHTITEEVMDVDLLQSQLRIAAGESLADLGIKQAGFLSPKGFALQARINMETMNAEGETHSTAGPVITAYEMPAGRGIRVDGYGYVGYQTNPRYDNLLAKLIVRSEQCDFTALLAKARRAISGCRIAGVDTNVPFLRGLLEREEMASGAIYTRFVDENAQALFVAATQQQGSIYDAVITEEPALSPQELQRQPVPEEELQPGSLFVYAPMQGMAIEITCDAGSAVSKGQPIIVIEAMKMVHHIEAPVNGVIDSVRVAVGDIVTPEVPVLIMTETGSEGEGQEQDTAEIDLDDIRSDVASLLERRRFLDDDARPDAVAKRRKRNQRTARENIDDLCDQDSFFEYGGLAIAAQRRRRSVDDLIRSTPGDGMVAGIGSVNGTYFSESNSQCAVLSYDYMVLAGTQGHQNHRKKDRLFELAKRRRLPVVLFSEGGGGRPGDTDLTLVAGLELVSFAYFAELSGLVPLIGINSGRCFAGNAALLGCCDVIIATENSSIGMGGPAMIEGGGLGVYEPEEVGPMSVQVPNGVVDIAVKDEAEAVAAAKKYLSYFQGTVADWTAPDQRRLRSIIPLDRVRVYDVRKIIDGLADIETVLEIRPNYGHGIITAFARIEGRPVGILASNPMHLGGAIDGPAADKASRFMQLCDAFDVSMISLCDTPGFMVGPESEKTAVVRRFARMFVVGAGMTAPLLTIVMRKAYGLGSMAMMAGHSKAPDFTVSWPNGEFGGMGLEGAVKLGMRKELEAIEDPVAREDFFQKTVAAAYEFGKATNAASHFEIDDVIDPAETRRWIMSALRSLPASPRRSGKKRSNIDTW